MITLISTIIAILIWMIINTIVYYIVDYYQIPYKTKVLDFKPFNCKKCCTFWTNLFANLILTISTNFTYIIASIIWLTLTSLTAIGMYVDDKNKTIQI